MINAAAMRHTKRARRLTVYLFRIVFVSADNFKQIFGFQPCFLRVVILRDFEKSVVFVKNRSPEKTYPSVFIV